MRDEKKNTHTHTRCVCDTSVQVFGKRVIWQSIATPPPPTPFSRWRDDSFDDINWCDKRWNLSHTTGLSNLFLERDENRKEVVQLVYLSAGTWYPIFSSTPVPTFFLPFDSLCTHLSCPPAIGNRPQDAWKQLFFVWNPSNSLVFLGCLFPGKPMKSNFKMWIFIVFFLPSYYYR
jgi:hypothetical protein